jgi:hypothetical protein
MIKPFRPKFFGVVGFFVELFNCPVSKFFPIIPQIIVMSALKTSFVNGNQLIECGFEDLNNVGD